MKVIVLAGEDLSKPEEYQQLEYEVSSVFSALAEVIIKLSLEFPEKKLVECRRKEFMRDGVKTYAFLGPDNSPRLEFRILKYERVTPTNGN